MAQQERERLDTSFKRMCLFCRKVYTENRAILLNHMAHDHNFSVGRPDNLVYVDELLDVLEEKLHKLLCLYCEKTFKDWQTLKEHMRKKQHKHINPRNSAYDKYYVVNYTEKESGEPVEEENSSELTETDTEVEWKDWQEEGAEANLICLICNEARTDMPAIMQHMKEAHEFDFLRVKEKLDFYQQIKVVNFLRKQVHTNTCFACSKKFQTQKELLCHLSTKEHDNNNIDPSQWDQPRFYFPTYENDQLLCFLEDENWPASPNECVVPEEVAPLNKLAFEALQRESSESKHLVED